MILVDKKPTFGSFFARGKAKRPIKIGRKADENIILAMSVQKCIKRKFHDIWHRSTSKAKNNSDLNLAPDTKRKSMATELYV